MNPYIASTRAKGCIQTIEYMFEDKLDFVTTNLQNVTMQRGWQVPTSQLNDTLIFNADASGIAKTDSSTPSTSPEQKPSSTKTKDDKTTAMDVKAKDMDDQKLPASDITSQQASVNVAPTQSTSITQILSNSVGIDP